MKAEGCLMVHDSKGLCIIDVKTSAATAKVLAKATGGATQCAALKDATNASVYYYLVPKEEERFESQATGRWRQTQLS
jgi:hypothetical protein